MRKLRNPSSASASFRFAKPDRWVHRSWMNQQMRSLIVEAVRKLGGDGYLLATLNRIGDTLSDTHIVAELEAWHKAYPEKAITRARYRLKEPGWRKPPER